MAAVMIGAGPHKASHTAVAICAYQNGPPATSKPAPSRQGVHGSDRAACDPVQFGVICTLPQARTPGFIDGWEPLSEYESMAAVAVLGGIRARAVLS